MRCQDGEHGDGMERERARRDEMRALARSALFLNSPPDIGQAALDFGFKKSAMPHAQTQRHAYLCRWAVRYLIRASMVSKKSRRRSSAAL